MHFTKNIYIWFKNGELLPQFHAVSDHHTKVAAGQNNPRKLSVKRHLFMLLTSWPLNSEWKWKSWILIIVWKTTRFLLGSLTRSAFVQKIESVIKQMRWKALFFLNPESDKQQSDTFYVQSRIWLAPNEELKTTCLGLSKTSHLNNWGTSSKQSWVQMSRT